MRYSAGVVLVSAFLSVPSITSGQDIHAAAREGDTATVRQLLEGDSELANARDERSCTPLHYAAASGSREVAQLLLQHGAEVDARDHENHTPLHWAAVRNQVAIADLLVYHGADLEARGNWGRTPLLLTARETGSVDMGSLLIERGADVNARSNYDETPLGLAAWRGFRGMVDLLLDSGAEVPTAPEGLMDFTRMSVQKGLVRLFEQLLRQGVDLSIRSENGGSLLHSASAGGSMEIVESLLAQGLPVGEQDRYGWTPLHYAAEKGRLKVAQALLDAGAELDRRSLSGLTPYNLAQTNERDRASEFLATVGADPSPPVFPFLRGEYLGQTAPANDAVPFALDIVSSNRFEHGTVTFSPDASEAFWSSSFEPADSGYSWSMILTSRLENGRWTLPAVASFSGALYNGDDVPFFAPDGQRLYFISGRSTAAEGSGGERIWYVDKTNDGWTEPQLIQGGPNSLDMHWQFSVAANRNIYFGSSDPGGFGRGDIYVSRYEQGGYLTPENLGNVVNSESIEASPFIAPDESYLLFMGLGQSDSRGGVDIYVAFKDAAGNWTPPVNLGEPVNSPSNEICPIVSPDGKYLFFNSFRNGNADNYWVDAGLVERLRPSGRP